MDQDDINVESLVLNESFQRFCLGSDKADKAYWENWLLNNPGKKAEFFKAVELYSILNGGNHAKNFENNRAVFQNRLIQEGILNEGKAEGKVVRLENTIENKSRFNIYKFFAAASILLIVLFAAYTIFKSSNQADDRADAKPTDVKKIDKSPGGDKAILTLANGKTIVLDSSATGLISEQDGIKVINAGGLLTYHDDGKNSEVLYHTISTPKGGQYQLLLADGSKVWLNSSSSLRFPSAFPGQERTVELNGEGYFEIAHNPAKPFHVKVNDMDVAVLGTHFNVMAYSDEESIKTTLLEGRVRVQKERAFVVLAPGQQAQVIPAGAIRIDKNADLEEAVAWKNGVFQFAGADMRTVMRHIGRWYDIETVLKGDMKNVHLSGKVSRSLNLSQVIQVLEESGIDIKTEGNKIIASPKP